MILAKSIHLLLLPWLDVLLQLKNAEDGDTVVCFFVFHDIGDPPSVTKYPVRERLVIGHALPV